MDVITNGEALTAEVDPIAAVCTGHGVAPVCTLNRPLQCARQECQLRQAKLNQLWTRINNHIPVFVLHKRGATAVDLIDAIANEINRSHLQPRPLAEGGGSRDFVGRRFVLANC